MSDSTSTADDERVVAKSDDKILRVQEQLDETTVLLQKNVQAVLQNVEETEKLEAKTEDMMKSAEQFKKTAREVKCAFCYNYWMWWVIGFCVILALFFILYFSLRKPSND